MIAFATLFLGLVLDVQTVEVMTSADVARVELRLDGRSLATLDEPPWRAEVDLGDELAPRRLEAIARDAEGREIARAEQALNVPRPPAVLEILLEPGSEGRGAVARVSWDSIAASSEPAVTVSFDGVELPVSDPRRIPLPDHDPARLHFLRVEASFGEHIASVAERVLGGTYADRLSAELTAVPVRLTGRRGLPPPERLDGWLRVDGAEEPVLAVDEGPADLVVVRDVSAQPALDGLRTSGWSSGQRFVARLKRDQRVRFLSPFARPVRHPGYSLSLFEPTETLTARDGGLYWLLTRVRPRHALDEGQRLADAVAAAGLTAAGGSRPRAVLLLLGPQPHDRSTLEPAAVRGYLASLRVPLTVWSLGDEGETAWGPAERIDSVPSLERAAKALRRELERQRILWIEGTHLPREIELTDAAREHVEPATAEAAHPAGGSSARSAAAQPAAGEAEPALGARSAFDLTGAGRSLEVAAGVRVRREPDPRSAPLATVDTAVELPVLERREGWARVRYGAWVGWVPAAGRELPESAGRAAGLVRRAPAAAERESPDPELLALALAGLSQPAPPSPLGPFTLYTDSRRRRLLERLREVGESLTETWGRRFGLPVESPRGAIVLYAAEAPYRAYLEAAVEPAARFARGHARGGVAALYIGDAAQEELPPVLVHEASHLLDHEILGRDLPPWLEEGLASDLSSSRIGADGRIEVGTWGGSSVVRRVPGGVWMRQSGALASRRQLLESWRRRRLAPVGELLTMSWERFLSEEDRSFHYQQATALVRYLLDGEGGALAAGFRAYLAAVAAGAEPDVPLLERSLGRTVPQIEHGLDLWLARQAAPAGAA